MYLLSLGTTALLVLLALLASKACCNMEEHMLGCSNGSIIIPEVTLNKDYKLLAILQDIHGVHSSTTPKVYITDRRDFARGFRLASISYIQLLINFDVEHNIAQYVLGIDRSLCGGFEVEDDRILNFNLAVDHPLDRLFLNYLRIYDRVMSAFGNPDVTWYRTDAIHWIRFPAQEPPTQAGVCLKGLGPNTDGGAIFSFIDDTEERILMPQWISVMVNSTIDDIPPHLNYTFDSYYSGDAGFSHFQITDLTKCTVESNPVAADPLPKIPDTFKVDVAQCMNLKGRIQLNMTECHPDNELTYRVWYMKNQERIVVDQYLGTTQIYDYTTGWRYRIRIDDPSQCDISEVNTYTESWDPYEDTIFPTTSQFFGLEHKLMAYGMFEKEDFVYKVYGTAQENANEEESSRTTFWHMRYLKKGKPIEDPSLYAPAKMVMKPKYSPSTTKEFTNFTTLTTGYWHDVTSCDMDKNTYSLYLDGQDLDQLNFDRKFMHDVILHLSTLLNVSTIRIGSSKMQMNPLRISQIITGNYLDGLIFDETSLIQVTESLASLVKEKLQFPVAYKSSPSKMGSVFVSRLLINEKSDDGKVPEHSIPVLAIIFTVIVSVSLVSAAIWALCKLTHWDLRRCWKRTERSESSRELDEITLMNNDQ